MYKLGQWIRDNYVFLNKGEYSNFNTLATSLDEEYCISSTQTVLAGLYPPNPEDSVSENIMRKSIPVYTVPKNLDKVKYK